MFGKKFLEVLFSQENVDLPPSTMHVHAITVPFWRNFHLRVRGEERQKFSSEYEKYGLSRIVSNRWHHSE
jgi:hypothetical protein